MRLALDCGELLPGHRFVITGLRQDGLSDDAMLSDLAGHRPGDRTEPMVSVTFELVPGLTSDEMDAASPVSAMPGPAEPRPPALWAPSGVLATRPSSSCT